MFLFRLIFLTTCISAQITETDLEKFGLFDCIEGDVFDLVKLNTNQDIKTFNRPKEATTENFFVNVSAQEEKGILTQLNELATFNDIEYHFELVKEEGLSHKKVFNVSLVLGQERFHGEDSSLKRAQIAAADTALKNTEYFHPPKKMKQSQKMTPTVLLNNICMKLGYSVQYYLIDDDKTIQLLSSKKFTFENYKKKTANDTLLDSHKFLKYRTADSPNIGPYHVKVKVQNYEFMGTGHTIQIAKHDAASKALDNLKKLADDKESYCTKEGMEDQCKAAKNSLKSPISLVYEAANKRSVEAKFDLIETEGPSHKPTFTIRCSLMEFQTVGRGKSKKEAKRLAAEQMLEYLPRLPQVPLENSIVGALKEKKKKRRKKKVLKTKVEKIEKTVGGIFDKVAKFTSTFGTSSQVVVDSQEVKTERRPSADFSPKKELLNMGSIFGFEISFQHFGKNGETHFSMANLHLKPPYLCIDRGADVDQADENVSLKALKFLVRGGLMDEIMLENRHKMISFDFGAYLALVQEILSEEKN